jgi:hypothetical protein
LKPLRLNKVLGLSVGEKSLLAAEVIAGDRPEVKRLAEFVYPEGISPQNPGALGAALADFLRDNKFTAKNAIVGLPARWLVVKPKEVPPADPGTLASMLRLQAEGEFSAELKDLVYDYAADTSAGNPRSVLLIATSKKYIDAAVTMCDAARLSAEIITSSAVALGVVTGRSLGAQIKNPLVLLVSPAGAELTAQVGTASSALRHLRGPGPDRPFVGELRRAISGMPGGLNGTPRELVLWDAAGSASFDSKTLGESLGVTVRTGDLPILGVNTSQATQNGDGRKYAAAVSLALLGVVEDTRPVDFLHSRLAPPKQAMVPLWMIGSALAAIALIALCIWAYHDLQVKQKIFDDLKADNDKRQPKVKDATDFTTKVEFAQAWHFGSPRYLACLRDLTYMVPQDGQTYALSLTLHDSPLPSGTSLTQEETILKSATVKTLAGKLEGKAPNQEIPQNLVRRFKAAIKNGVPSPFTDVALINAQLDNRKHEVTFTIGFTYNPPAGTP